LGENNKPQRRTANILKALHLIIRLRSGKGYDTAFFSELFTLGFPFFLKGWDEREDSIGWTDKASRVNPIKIG